MFAARPGGQRAQASIAQGSLLTEQLICTNDACRRSTCVWPALLLRLARTADKEA